MILAILAALVLPHLALGFVLGRTAAIRAFILEAGVVFGIGLLVLLGAVPAVSEGANAEGLMGLFGVIGAAFPIIGLGYAGGVTLRWPFLLPREGFLWRVTRVR